MEDMSGYFKKWREWRNTDLGIKSFTSIRVEKDEAKDNQLTNQPINQQINRLNVNHQILAFNMLLEFQQAFGFQHLNS